MAEVKVGQIVFLCAECKQKKFAHGWVSVSNLDAALAGKCDEIERLRADLEKAKAALRMAQSILAQFREPDMRVNAASIFAQICEAEACARATLDELEGEAQP